MSISDGAIKLIGVILAVAGLFITIVAAQVLITGFTVSAVVGAVVGLIMIGIGVVIVRGGNITA